MRLDDPGGGRTNAYRVMLDDGYDVWAPFDDDRFVRSDKPKDPDAIKFFVAVKKGDLKTVTSILRRKRQLLNATSDRDNKKTALHLAVENKHTDVTKHLLKLKANCRRPDKCGDTPLHIATRCDYSQGVTLLIEARANLNVQNMSQDDLHDGSFVKTNKDGTTERLTNLNKTPLHIAVEENLPEMVSILLKNKAALDIQDASQFAPLHIAVEMEDEEIVDQLIQAKANTEVGVPDFGGFTPLGYACSQRLHDIAEILVKSNARVDRIGSSGMQPVHVVARKGDTKMLQMLIDNGADPIVKDKKGNLPLFYADKNKKVKAVTLLKQYSDLQRGDIVAISELQKSEHLNGQKGQIVQSNITRGRFAIVMQNESKQRVLVKPDNLTLVERPPPEEIPPEPKNEPSQCSLGSDNDEKTDSGQKGAKTAKKFTAKMSQEFLMAAKNNDTDAITKLLDASMDPNFQNELGQSALHIAAIWGKQDVAKLLVEGKANVNIQNDQKLNLQTPLHMAVRRERLDFAVLLVKIKADANKCDLSGKAPWEYCDDKNYIVALGGDDMD